MAVNWEPIQQTDYLPGLTAEDRQQWEKDYSIAIKDAREQGMSEKDITRVYYNTRFAEVFGDEALNTLSENQRDSLWANTYLEVQQEKRQKQLAAENKAFLNTYITHYDDHHDPDENKTYGNKVIDILGKAAISVNALPMGSAAVMQTYNTIDTAKKHFGEDTPVSRITPDLLEDDSYYKTKTEEFYQEYQKRQDEERSRQIKEAQQKDQEYDKYDVSLSEINEIEERDGYSPFTTNPKVEQRRLQELAAEVRSLNTPTKQQVEMEKLKHRIESEDKIKSTSDNIFNDLTTVVGEKTEKEYTYKREEALKNIKEIALENSGYYRAFYDEDKIKNINGEEWLELYAQYQATASILGEQEANERLNTNIQLLARQNETIPERAFNALAGMGSQVMASAIMVPAAAKGLLDMVSGEYESVEGINPIENLVNAMFIDNDVAKYAAAVSETGSMFPSQQEWLEYNGVNQFQITNPNQEISWWDTPFEVLQQHGFTLATMGLSLGSSAVVKGVSTGVKKMIPALSKYNNIVDPIKRMQILRKASKWGDTIGTISNGVVTPMLVGVPEATLNAIQTYENILTQNENIRLTLLQKELDARIDKKIEEEYDTRMKYYQDNNGRFTENGHMRLLTPEDMHNMVMAEIQNAVIAESQDLYEQHEEIKKQQQYSATRGALNTLYATSAINGTIGMTFKSLQMAPPVQKAINRIKSKVKPIKSKYKTSLDGDKIVVTPKSKKSTFWSDRAKNKNQFVQHIAERVDNLWNYGLGYMKEPLGEFLEEWGQGVTQNIFERAAGYNITSFIDNRYSGDGTAELYSYIDGTLSESLSYALEEAIDKDNIHAGILGALGSLIPRVNLDPSGGRFTTGLQAGYKKSKQKYANIQATAQAIQTMINDPSQKPIIEGLQTIAAFDKDGVRAAKDGDKFNYKNSLLGIAVAQAQMLSELEGTEYRASIIKTLEDAINAEYELNDAGQLMSGTVADRILKSIRRDPQLAKQYEDMSDAEVIERVKQNSKHMLDIINKVSERNKQLKAEYGDDIDTDVRRSLIFGEMLRQNQNERLEELRQKNRDRQQKLLQSLPEEELDNPNVTAADKRILIRYGSKDQVLKKKEEAKKKIDEIQEKIDELIKRKNKLKKDKNPDKEVRQNYKFVKNEINRLKTLQQKIRKQIYNADIELSKEAREKDYVFSAREILEMDEVSRNYMLDPKNLANRSEKQQQIIKSITDAMKVQDATNGEQSGSFLQDVLDQGRLAWDQAINDKQYIHVLENTEAYNQYAQQARYESSALIAKAQAENINAATTYEEYLGRVNLYLEEDESNPVAQLKNSILRKFVTSPFAMRHSKESNFIDSIDKQAEKAANKEDISITEGDVLLDLLNYVIDSKISDNQFDVDNISIDDIINALGDKNDFINWVDQNDSSKTKNIKLEYIRNNSSQHLTGLLYKQIENYNKEVASRRVNQEVVRPEVVVDNSTTNPVVPDPNAEINEQQEDQEEVQEDYKKTKAYKTLLQLEEALNGINATWKSKIQEIINSFKSKLKEETISQKDIEAELIKAAKIVDVDTYMKNLLNSIKASSNVANTSKNAVFAAAQAEKKSNQLGRQESTLPVNTEAVNIDLYFSQDILGSWAEGKYANFGIEEYLRKNGLPEGTEVYYILYKVAGFNPTSSAEYPILACVKSKDGPIKTAEGQYQPIGLLPASTNKNKQGSASTSGIRQQALGLTQDTEFQVIKDQDGQDLKSIIQTSDAIKVESAINKTMQETHQLGSVEGLVPEGYKPTATSSNRKKSLTTDKLRELFQKIRKVGNDFVFKIANSQDEIIKSKRVDVESEFRFSNTSEIQVYKDAKTGGVTSIFIQGVDQDIASSAVKLANLVYPITFEKATTEIDVDISGAIKDRLYIPNNVKFVIRMNGEVRTLHMIVDGADINIGSISYISSGKLQSDDNAFINSVEILGKILTELKNKGIEVNHQLDNRDIEAALTWAEGDGVATHEIINTADRLLKYGTSSTKTVYGIPVQVSIPSPFGSKGLPTLPQNRTSPLQEKNPTHAEKQDNNVVISAEQTVKDIVDQMSIEEPNTMQDKEAQEIAEKEQVHIEENKRKTIGTTRLVKQGKDISGINPNVASRIGNVVNNIVRDIIDGIEKDDYPNMTKEEVKILKTAVTNALLYLNKKGWSRQKAGGYRGGFNRKAKSNTRRLALKGVIKGITKSGKTITIPTRGEMDLLFYNKNGDVLILDVKTILAHSISEENIKYYSSQLSIYKETLTQQATGDGRHIHPNNVQIAVLAIPMDYTISEDSTLEGISDTVVEDEDNQLIEAGTYKYYTGAKLRKGASIQVLEVGESKDSLKEVSMQEIIDEAIAKDPDIVNLYSEEAQSAIEEHNQSKDTSKPSPEPIIKEGEKIEVIKEEEDDDWGIDNDYNNDSDDILADIRRKRNYEVGSTDKKDKTTSELEQEEDCRKQ